MAALLRNTASHRALSTTNVTKPTTSMSILPVIHQLSATRSRCFGPLVLQRRQELRPFLATFKSTSGSANATTVRPKRTGKEASAPLPSGEDDILLVPCAHLHLDQLENHDIFTLSDFRRAYEKDKVNFRRFLQDKIQVKEERQLAAMEAFCRALDTAAAATTTAAAPPTGGPSQAAQVPPPAAAAAPAPVPLGLTTEQVTLSVEGNISAGKSTFLSILDRHLFTDKGYCFVKEPIEQWQAVGGSSVNLLELFYRDPARMAYTFQNFVFLTRMLQERETFGSTAKARILERSIFSDRMVFVRAVHASKDLADHELVIFDAWFGPILASLPTLVPNGLVYLRASPETCMARLKKRARSEEGGIPLEYLQTLHRNHEDWLLLASTPAVALKKRLLEQQQQQQGQQQQGPAQTASAAAEVNDGEYCSGSSSASVDSAAERSGGQASPSSPSSPSSSSALLHHIHDVAAAMTAVLRPLSEAPPPALAEVDIPPSLEGCLYIIDATKIPGVPSAGFLHQVPTLVVDCEEDVDVDGDVAHGERVSTLVRDYCTFVSQYRSACHRLAAEAHPHSAPLRLPRPEADYYTSDATGRVTYRPVVHDVPGTHTAAAFSSSTSSPSSSSAAASEADSRADSDASS